MTAVHAFPTRIICKKSTLPRPLRLKLLEKGRKPCLRLSDKSVMPLVIFFRRSRKAIEESSHLKNIMYPIWHIHRMQHAQTCPLGEAIAMAKNPHFRLAASSCLLARTDSTGFLGNLSSKSYVVERLKSSAEFVEVVMRRQVKHYLEKKTLSSGRAMTWGWMNVPGPLMDLVARAILAIDMETISAGPSPSGEN